MGPTTVGTTRTSATCFQWLVLGANWSLVSVSKEQTAVRLVEPQSLLMDSHFISFYSVQFISFHCVQFSEKKSLLFFAAA